ELAKLQNVPPYVIFHDATLMSLAQARPGTLQAMGKISGVGSVKLEKYGQAILDVIARPV
ncbi:MAG: HRDC domain-containing protein, partial [Alphaproteobacteria bacterium]|nr:HRDC domain-containing protein [Alphaproteobacteria bacterium]